MNDILRTYMERFREDRHTLRRYTAFVLALAMITTLFVNWQLHGVGISMTAQYQCGEEEHTHTADCYTKVLTCGYNEGDLENAAEVAAAEASQPTVEAEPMPLALEPQIEFVPHEHTEDCYTEVQTLTCMEEEHVHGDDCFDPEDGSLICDKFEHTHDESCYTTEYELTCGLEEGELVEQVVEPTQSAELAAMAVAEPVALAPMVDTVEPIYHHHTDACYEEVLTCPLPEHHHTVACLSDTSADLETPEEWQAANAEAVMTGNWAEDLVSVAQTQLGYEQSEKNFEIDPADGVTLHYYSRYGQSYGNPYGEWDVMFLSYCLKYAGIPQSAIPQEASVLALRSSMSDMEWLLDGEDGSAADVGDIVIYNKYVTRTVAVDSSADGAADSLDDLFSMDAEGENGVELEGSGAAALDTAPAAEDATTLDTPDLPDIPDTVDTDQPAKNPVDSTGTAVPSVVSPAAEPQTTTVTDAQPVETVGIVSAVDDNTLTVISGDVDGKVAEVTLSSAEVLGVVSVASAQYADEMLSSAVDGALRASDMLLLAGEPTTVSTATTLQESWITGTTITINNVVQTGSSIDLKTGDKVVLDYNFSIPANTFNETDTNRSLTYQLPTGIYLSTAIQGQDITQSGKVIGKMDVSKTGLVTLHLNDDFDAHQPFKGSFGLEAKVTTEKLGDGGSISFPGSSVTIKVTDPKDIRINKTGSIDESVSGKTIIHYTVTVTSDNGWNGEVYIKDKLNNTTSTSTSYVQGSFALKDKNNNPIDWNKCTFTWDTDLNGFAITGLPAMAKGEKYILTYDVEVTAKNAAADGSYVINNNSARTNDEKPVTPWIQHNALLFKSGTYDPDTNLITWVVTVTNYNGGTIPKGYTLNDVIKTAGQTIVGDIKVTEKLHRYYGDETLFDTITGVSGESSFEYKFPRAATGEEYKFTYTTTAPATVGQKVRNEASVPGGSTYSEAEVKDRGWNLNKAATKSTLEETDKANIYKAYWKITTAVPNNWDKKTITDYIYTPNKPDEGAHYGIAAELDTRLKSHLYFNCTDGTSLSYQEAVAAGIGIEITYYSVVQDKYMTADQIIQASDSTSKVQSFKIELTNNYNGNKHIKELMINDYYTYVDVTGVPNDKKVQYENKAGTSAYYSYEKKTPDTPSEIKKGVSGTKQNGISTGSGNNQYGKTATVSYNNDGKTYLYYQVLVDVSEWKNEDDTFKYDTITVTDKLPEGVTYVDGSAEATFWYKDGSFWNILYNQYDYVNGNKTPKLPQTHDLRDATFFDAQTTGNASSGQTLDFNFKHLQKLETGDAGSLKIKGFLIRYTVELDTTSEDSIWRDPETTNHDYTNTVSWNGHSDYATATVNRVVTVLEKSGQQSVNTSGAKTNGADYTIKINPTGKDLVPGKNYLTLTDTLTVQKGFAATLDRESVKLYDANDLDNPLSDNSYTFSYFTSVNEAGENVYTMVLTIPDQRAFVLKYSYDTDAKNQNVELKNTADLEGKWESETSKKLDEVNGWARVEQGLLTINKVDSLNQKVGLEDAEFTLSRFNPETGKWETDKNQTMRTDSNGKVAIYVGSSTSVTMNATTLYRLTETDPPDGYRKSDVAYYFVWTPSSWTGTDQELYNQVVGSNVQPGEEVPQFKNVIVYQYGTAHDLYIKNDRNELTIQKFWVNKNGQNMNPTDETSVTVKLYKYKADGTNGSRKNGIYVTAIELTSANNWTATYKNLEEGYLYYIEEASTGGKYEVIYSDSNTAGVENGGLLTLTNKEKDNTDYELPSTGGTGTLPYTAVGGTMMLSALAYSFIHRKRRREGRADG